MRETHENGIRVTFEGVTQPISGEREIKVIIRDEVRIIYDILVLSEAIGYLRFMQPFK